MRLKERIDIVLKHMDIDLFLSEANFDKQTILSCKNFYRMNIDKIRDYWLQIPDLRFGQMLINLGYIPDRFRLWDIEEVDWMLQNGLVGGREILFWGQQFDKDGNKLSKVIYKPIKDLETDHIEKILETQPRLSILYVNYFKQELLDREKIKHSIT